MTALYVTSVEASAGKTAMCAVIAKRLQADGKKVGYLKPVVVDAPAEADADMRFVARILGQSDVISSIAVKPRDLIAPDVLKRAKAACLETLKGRDTILLEGLSGVTGERGEFSARLAEAIGAKALVILRWDGRDAPDQVTAFARQVKDRLAGVVINGVPSGMMDEVRSRFVPLFESQGIKTLGIIADDRGLMAVSVGELIESLGGDVSNLNGQAEDLVESVMVGALSIDSGLDYFKRKSNKAVVTRGDRPDIQNAALETSTKLLILTNGKEPIAQIKYRAEEKRVPLVKVRQDTREALALVEDAFARARFHSAKKLDKFSQLLAKNFDFKALYSALGL